MIKLINNDCLKAMDDLIEEGVKVDAVICDPPYGVTACKWDSVIDFDEMWKRLDKLIKENGAVVLFGSEPFSSALRMSNIKNYRYDWVWNKSHSTSFALAKKQPMRTFEIISIFYKTQCIYNPIMVLKKSIVDDRNWKSTGRSVNANFSSKEKTKYLRTHSYPKNIINISSQMNECNNKNRHHPTQKPVPLMEYLIKTYTNENETVLDFTMGSGTTGVACVQTKRNFIGIELDKTYFDIATERINEAKFTKPKPKKKLFN